MIHDQSLDTMNSNTDGRDSFDVSSDVCRPLPLVSLSQTADPLAGRALLPPLFPFGPPSQCPCLSKWLAHGMGPGGHRGWTS